MYLRTDAIESQYDLIVRYNQNANRVSVVDLPSSGSSAQAELVDILIDGKQVKNFEPDRFEYEIVNTWGTAVPQVDVVPREITTKFNMQLEGQDRIVIQAESKDGRVRNDYVFKIAPYLGFGNVTVEKITDLGEETPEKSGGNAMDGDLSTNSTTEGDGIPMEFDFGREVSLSAVGIACYIGNTRKAFFEFQSSLDGQSWQKVFDGSSSGTTSDFEYYDMKNTRARYVRMIGHGNSTNLKNSFYEICFLTGTNFLTAFHLEGEAQMKAEETQLLTPAGVMFGGTPADFSKGALSYSSSDSEVASVDAEGRVTALKKGTATITASFVLEDMTSTARLEINVTDGTFMNEDFESYADGYGLNLPWGSTFGDAENQACAAKLPDGGTAVRLTATTPSIYPYISYPIKCKGKVVVEFDVMSDSMMGEKRIQFTPTGTGYLPFIRIGDTGDFYAYDSDNWVRLRTYRPGKWYHFKALVDTEAQRYDVWVDQVQYGRDLAFKPDQGNGKLYDWSNGLMTIRPDIHVTVEKSASFYMDNFKVYEYQETEGTSK